MGVIALDQVHPPVALPLLELLLATNGRLGVVMCLKPDEAVNAVFGREAGNGFCLVLPDALE